MVSFAALLFAAAPATVTYNGPTARMEILLPAVGSLSGEMWQADGRLKDVPIFLNVSDMEVTQLRVAIADACEAKWVERDEVLTLVPDSDRAQIEVEKWRAEMTAAWANREPEIS